MYGDIDYDNICERMQLAQVSRKAAEGCRFGRHKGRMLSAAWAGLKALMHKGISIKGSDVVSTRERRSY